MVTSRRTLLAAALSFGCRRGIGQEGARLHASPKRGRRSAPAPGLRSLHIRKTRDPQLYVPRAAASEAPAPFLMYLHGATGSEEEGIRRLRDFSDQFGFVLLSPGSTGERWDAIRGEYGPDVRMLDAALERSFELCNVDSKRVCVCGFSDGGSYALGIGLANGDLFRSLIAFSPGFVPAGFEPEGHPRVFISHGTEDRILPIDTCSRQMVPELKRRQYDVTYREFKGPHTVPHAICEEALQWFTG